MTQLSKIKPNSEVSLKLKTISRYYHAFLDQFRAVVISSSDTELVIHAPIKNSSEKHWTLFADEIDFIEEIIDSNEKTDSN